MSRFRHRGQLVNLAIQTIKRPVLRGKMRFKLPRGGTNNIVFNTRLRVKTRVMSEPVWLRAMEKNPGAGVLPKRKGWTRKALPQLQAPKDVLSGKVRKHVRATRAGRELARAFGGQDSFADTFVERQMARIRDGVSEPEAFRSVMSELRAELEDHQEAVAKAYTELVEERGGLSLSDFIEAYAPVEELSRWAEDRGTKEEPPPGMEREDMDLILDMARVGVIDVELDGEGADGEKLNYFWNDASKRAKALESVVDEMGAAADAERVPTLEPLSVEEVEAGGEEMWTFEDNMVVSIGENTFYSVPPEVWSNDGATMPLLFTLDGDLVGALDSDTGEIVEVEVGA